MDTKKQFMCVCNCDVIRVVGTWYIVTSFRTHSARASGDFVIRTNLSFVCFSLRSNDDAIISHFRYNIYKRPLFIPTRVLSSIFLITNKVRKTADVFV